MLDLRRLAAASLMLTSLTSLGVFALAGCSKPDPGAQPEASTATPSTATTSTPAASAAPTATATETAAAAAPDAASVSEDAGKVAAKEISRDAAAPSAPSGSGASGNGANECGTKPLPDCPLQAWMKANSNMPITTNDTAALAVVYDKIATFAPPGYTNWASISKDGAKAARAGDMPAAKAACRTCHDQYKQKYKTEIRARKI